MLEEQHELLPDVVLLPPTIVAVVVVELFDHQKETDMMLLQLLRKEHGLTVKMTSSLCLRRK